MDTIEWLLDSDPAIRWQAMRDLLGKPAEEVAAERAKVSTQGWRHNCFVTGRPTDNGPPTCSHRSILVWMRNAIRHSQTGVDLDHLITVAKSKRTKDGRWRLENTHAGRVHFAMDEGDGRPSRWNTWGPCGCSPGRGVNSSSSRHGPNHEFDQ